MEREQYFKDLKLVKFSPNTAASDIENCLEINFSKKPKKIDWNKRNIYALGLNCLMSPELFTKMVTYKTWSGFYLSDFHTFINKSGDHLIDCHENMHGLVQLINPSVHNWRHWIKNSAHSISKLGYLDLREPLLSVCLTEGVATWGEVQVGLKSKDSMLQTQANINHNWWSNNVYNQNGKLELNRDLMRENFERINEVIKTSRTLTQQMCDANSMRECINLWKKILGMSISIFSDRILYFVGYNFVYESIEYLTKEGLPTPDALMRVIKNPPKSLEDLQNPRTLVMV